MNEEKPLKGKKGKYYVNPVEFEKLILEYYDNEVMTEEVAEMISMIANRLAFSPNFINYTYREEMVGDALVKMFQALTNKKFQPDKGNPFSYYTKIAFNAFCNRIKKEKKEREAVTSYQDEMYSVLMDEGLIPTQSHSGKPTDTDSGYED
jgi:DNA-directed RNA polymerase specialized sigma24 family protein